MLQRILAPLVDLREEEGVTALLMFAYSFLAMAGYNVVKPATRSQFIDSLGADNIPYVQLVAGLIMGFVIQAYTSSMRLLPRRWVFAATQAVMVGLLILFWTLFKTEASWVSVVFYLWGVLAGSLLISQFWSRNERQGLSLASILVLSGLLLIPVVFLRTLPMALLFMGLAGFAAAPYYVVEQSLIQRLVPGDVQGQVFGARGALSVAGYPLGGAAGGALMVGIAAPFVVGMSALLCIGMGSACLVSPTLRTMRRNGSSERVTTA